VFEQTFCLFVLNVFIRSFVQTKCLPYYVESWLIFVQFATYTYGISHRLEKNAFYKKTFAINMTIDDILALFAAERIVHQTKSKIF